jgi:hypothetical protein
MAEKKACLTFRIQLFTSALAALILLPAPGKDEYKTSSVTALFWGSMQTETKKISYKKTLLVCTGRAQITSGFILRYCIPCPVDPDVVKAKPAPFPYVFRYPHLTPPGNKKARLFSKPGFSLYT